MSGRINLSNLSDSLKEHLNGLGLTEEQVNELIENALVEINEKNGDQDEVVNGLVDKVGELNGLMTEEKGDLVGAINELFQSANNGKQLIANAIGEPVSKDDTFQAMSNDINGLLSTFKANMMNNGVTVEANDKFKNLIDKIATLADSEGKGVQFASGVTENVYGSQVNDPSNLSINVPINLDFEPTYFLICIPKIQGRMGWASYTNLLLSNFANSQTQNAHGGGGTHTLKVTMSNITTSNFLLTIYSSASGSTYGAAAEINCQITWYAIGVGEEDTTLLDSLKSILAEEGVSVTEEDDMASLIGKVDEEFTKDNNEITNLTNELAGKVTPAGTAVAGDVLSGKTFINNTGQTITGTMAKMSTHTEVAEYVAWDENSIYLGIPAGAYVNTSSTGYPEVYIGKTRLDSNLVPENIVSGKSICGVAGTAKSITGLSNVKKIDLENLTINVSNSTTNIVSNKFTINPGFTPSLAIIVLVSKLDPSHTTILMSTKHYSYATSAQDYLYYATSPGSSTTRTSNIWINSVTSTTIDISIYAKTVSVGQFDISAILLS